MDKRFLRPLCLLLAVLVLLPASSLAVDLTKTQLPGYYVALGTPTKDLQKMADEAGWALLPSNSKNGTFYAVYYPIGLKEFRYEDEKASLSIYWAAPERGAAAVVTGSSYFVSYATEEEAKAQQIAWMNALQRVYGATPVKNKCLFRHGTDYVLVEVNYSSKSVYVTMQITKKLKGLEAQYGFKGSNPQIPVFPWEPMGFHQDAVKATPVPTAAPKPMNNSVVDGIKDQMVRDTQDLLNRP